MISQEGLSSFLCEKVEGTPGRCVVGLPGTVPPEEPVTEARGKARWVIVVERNLRRSGEDRAERARPGAKTWLCCSGQGKERMVKNPFLETFLGHAVRLVGSQVLDEGLNPGHDGQGAKAEPPGHQGSPWRHTCFKCCDPLCSALSLDSECLGLAGAPVCLGARRGRSGEAAAPRPCPVASVSFPGRRGWSPM